MLNIDNKELKVTKQQIKVEKCVNNKIKGYNVVVQPKFFNNDEKGYLNLSAGFEETDDIINFINKEYKGIPFNIENQINLFEVFDTNKFLDTEIESEIILKLKNIKDNMIEAYIEINDELINIKFNGYLEYVK